MIKKLLLHTVLYQTVLLTILLALIFGVVVVYEHQRMQDATSDNLTRAQNVPYEEYFPEDGKISSLRFEKKIAAICVRENSTTYLISDENFCPTKLKERIVFAAQEKSEGVIESDGYRMAYRMVAQPKGAIIYVYDNTSDYAAYRSNLILILVMGAMVFILVVFFIIYFTKRNLAPVETTIEKQKELIANASHELKTPLTILTTQIEVVRGFEELKEDHKKWVDGIEEQVKRMSHLVHEMLELARFESSRSEDNFRIVNLSELADKVTLGIEALAFENAITIETDIQPNVMIYADPDGIEKVVYILLENAVKYTPSKEKIIIRVYVNAHRAVLQVRNTGIACPKDDIPLLFDRFYRGDKAHTSENNYGLGLSIAHAIIERNKGKIGCNSVNNGKEKYTEFIVNLRQLPEKQISKKEKHGKKNKK